jgi:hypothetical protein
MQSGGQGVLGENWLWLQLGGRSPIFLACCVRASLPNIAVIWMHEQSTEVSLAYQSWGPILDKGLEVYKPD